ncbi:hypothetical protein [Haliangium ochraceum]|uniref:Uncharacterized protein n=1 Tax=Haliangium ochraceum (strain DSM 14365 / JCM 11303 / SMP-2) TaxID=502025 RepID=D0LFL4_HALO1|nr:hypothetical protein [Haliangium ochraceum]ACY12648.1 hypothetical protein Hoch_0006 [Haliangium ochraceum DSM 14365]
MSAQYQDLEQQNHELREENQALRAELERIEARAAKAAEARTRLMRGSWRILVPLIDRQRVARSFGKLAQTASEFANPPAHWPTKEQILAEARDFMESCVRFTIRRRTLLLVFSLLAAAIPAFQMYLVVQQNEMIENQNEFFGIQVYDIVSRTMTEGDRNARQMTGALLANAKVEFLSGVVEEAFGAGGLGFQWGAYRRDDIDAQQRRLEDAAFRGHLIRSVVRAVQHRGDGGKHEMDADELHAAIVPSIRQILRDTADRMPQVLRLGRQDGDIDPALLEQVDYYLIQVGELLRVYGRIARSADEEAAFFDDIRPLFQRIGGRRDLEESRFAEVYRPVLQDFLFELALQPKLDSPPVNLETAGTSPDEALNTGIERLRKGLGEQALNWNLFKRQVAQ